ncbi:MAG: type II toxin-antitoxin system HipA family toxin [Kiritimatiellia bacterium]|jgi:serine/threonine-protein kinase HipA|nr:type II toxin-antitoxin system HipA family toxin [Kiritimatiellia bacterium]
MRRLAVYLAGAAVGDLEQDDSGLLKFRYRPEWLARDGASALSRSLPLQGTAFRGRYARAFFAGILPEEEPRRRIASILGVSERNDFALLERLGGECAGAVSLLPEGAAPPATGEARVRELSDGDLRRIVTELPDRPLLAGEDGLRLSLAGAQDKLPVVVLDGRVALPLGDTPSTHIIKPEPLRFPGLAANEFFCMTLAKAVGLKVAEVKRFAVGDKPCLLLQRYDRTVASDGTVTRIHQEDFCQALGFPPEHKYQQEGGPLLRDCVALLREWSTAPVLDLRDFIDGQIFNVLIGNADAHGKNYSMLYQGGQRRLAPFYDLVCTLAWPELSKTPAMKIGGCASLDVFTAAPWQKMAQEARLGWPMIRERMEALCAQVIDTLRGSAMREAMTGEMEARLAALALERASALRANLTR